MTLEVRASNEAALNLYRKMGFIQVNVSKSYYPDGEDAIVMTLALQEDCMIIIGIESSCDETAVAVVKDKKEVYRVWSQAKLMCIRIWWGRTRSCESYSCRKYFVLY